MLELRKFLLISLALLVILIIYYWKNGLSILRNISAQVQTADQAWKNQDLESAHALIEKIFSRSDLIEQPIRNPKAWLVRGKVQYSIGNLELSLKHLDKAVQLAPTSDTSIFFRGLVKIGLKDIDGAISDFTQVLRLNPDYCKAWTYRGIARGEKMNYVGMISDCTASINCDSRDPFTWNRRGRAKERLGQLRSALMDYEMAFSLDDVSVVFQEDYFNLLKKSLIPKPTNDLINSTFLKIHLVSIGIGIYQQDYQFNPLEFTVAGASAIKNLFERRNLVKSALFLHDSGARRKDILAALESFAKSNTIEEDDLVIFYFSGHGLLVDGKTGICPYDYQSAKDLITDQEIAKILSRSPASQRICFLEACKSEKSADYIDPALVATVNYRRQNITPGIVFMTSTEVGKKSWGGTEGYFTKAILEALEKGKADVNGDRIVTAEELFKFVQPFVKRITNNDQVPQVNKEYPKNLEVMHLPN